MGYLTRDESWAVPATLSDKEGQVRWRSKSWPGIDDSVSGDVNGDGKLSVVIGFNGGGGLLLLDGQGKELWKKEESNVWHVETLDTNGDGREEILHSNAKGELLVRNGNGDVIARYLPNFYFRILPSRAGEKKHGRLIFSSQSRSLTKAAANKHLSCWTQTEKRLRS